MIVARKARLVVAVALVVSAWVGARASIPYWQATALILDLTESAPALRSWLPVKAQAVTVRDIDVPTRNGPVRARLYQPTRPTGRTVALFPGVHAGGVDEPRMGALSRKLAASGLTVLSAPLPELRVFMIRPRSTDDIEDIAVWLAAQRDLAPRGRIGLVGVSFAGGLALVAAGRPSLAGKLELVGALGSHGDLPRAMRYLCTGEMPDGTVQPPHDYGATVIMLAGLHHFAPAEQIEPLRRAVMTFLNASSYDVTDPPKSSALFAEARQQGAALPEPARTVMGWINNRDVKTMGPKLVPYIEELGGAAALSPERSPAATVPVFLLHGSHDNVIPFTETPQIGAYLRARGSTRVTTLLTPLISHANVEGSPSVSAVWQLIRFWAAMLDVA